MTDYTRVKSGDWYDPGGWSPRGVPGPAFRYRLKRLVCARCNPPGDITAPYVPAGRFCTGCGVRMPGGDMGKAPK